MRRRALQRPAGTMQQKGVIVALHPLLVAIAQEILQQRFRLAEIHAAAVHRRQIGAGNALGVDRQVAIGEQLQPLGAGVGAGAVQIEIGVVGQIDRAGAIDLRQIVDFQAIIRGQAVTNLHVEIAGETLIALRRMQRIADLLRIMLHPAPAAGMKTVGATVQLMGALIGGQRMGFPADGQTGVGDAVGVTADGGTQIAP